MAFEEGTNRFQRRKLEHKPDKYLEDNCGLGAKYERTQVNIMLLWPLRRYSTV